MDPAAILAPAMGLPAPAAGAMLILLGFARLVACGPRPALATGIWSLSLLTAAAHGAGVLLVPAFALCLSPAGAPSLGGAPPQALAMIALHVAGPLAAAGAGRLVGDPAAARLAAAAALVCGGTGIVFIMG